MSTARSLGWAVLYALVVAAAVVLARGGAPFVYQGF